ncbi:MAG: RNA polymerase sigma-70 factor [Mangrovibacterium sp.]
MINERNISKEKARTLEKLFAKSYSALCFFAFSFLKDEEAAEDIAQEAFESLWVNFEKIENIHAVQLSYLYNTTRNKCLNSIRHEKVKNELSDKQESELFVNWETDHLDTLIKSEVYNELFSAIASLPAQCRKIYEMTYLEKMSEKEIAERLSISIHSVKSQKQRGKQLLKETLKDLFAVLVSI